MANLTSLNQMNTAEQYAKVIESCRDTFLKKTADYGTSWRVYRIISVADQIYIKGRRIRTIQEKKDQKIADGIRGELEGIVNYGVIGLIQLRLNTEEVHQMAVEEVRGYYDQVIQEARDLMMNKNHDYGEAWREMSQESFVDLILAKILRIRQIVANKGMTIASEGIDANLYDIINYAVFALILMEENQ